MKKRSLFKLLIAQALAAGFASLTTLSALAQSGGAGNTGGGHSFALAVVEEAGDILNCLQSHSDQATKDIGINLVGFEKALDTIGMVCADEPAQKLMEFRNQQMAYSSKTHTILIRDCGLLANWPAGETIVHEYFRSLGEGNEYRYSKRIRPFVQKYCPQLDINAHSAF